MTDSWMLARLNRETKQHHQLANHDRLAILGAGADARLYAAHLARIYGFEAPVETALAMTTGLDEWIDLRGRGHLRLLRADLQALGVTDPSEVARCPAVAPFRDVAEALAWMYVVERNTLVHGLLERHLRSRMPAVMKGASSYLAAQQRTSGQRLGDIAAAMDRFAKDSITAERIVAAASNAFRTQHAWYDVAVPQRTRVA